MRSGVVSPYNGNAKYINCRGLGTCGTCAVEINNQSEVEPSQRKKIENFRLNFPPHNFHE